MYFKYGYKKVFTDKLDYSSLSFKIFLNIAKHTDTTRRQLTMTQKSFLSCSW